MVAGKSCRVVTSATDEELQRFALLVEEKLADVLQPGRPLTTKAMLLAAVALAHDVDEQRARADAIAKRAQGALGELLEQVDCALEKSDQAAKQREGRRRASAKRSGDATIAVKAKKVHAKQAGDESTSPP